MMPLPVNASTDKAEMKLHTMEWVSAMDNVDQYELKRKQHLTGLESDKTPACLDGKMGMLAQAQHW